MKAKQKQTLLSKKELLDIFVHHRVDSPYPGDWESKGIQILETFETKLPADAKGMVPLYDFETGRTTLVDLSRWRDVNHKMEQRLSEIKEGLNQWGIDLLTLTPDDNFPSKINAFMKHPR